MTRAGTVALVGRPNVGKSSLMNALLGTPLSIVSPKAQTTRHRVLGIHTVDDCQFVFVDTPGQADRQGQALNRLLDRTALAAMADVDVVLWLVQAGRWLDADSTLHKRLQQPRPRCLGLVVSQVDRIADKARLLPELGRLQTQIAADFVVPVSATRGDNLDALLAEISTRLPAGEWPYPADTLTPHGGRFLIAEQLREQLFHRLHQELPYAVTVTVEEVDDSPERLSARATIWVNRPAHRAMVIGRKGQTLKHVGTAARRRLEQLFERPVHLDVWVKLREGWADHEESLRSFGYGASE